MSVAATDLCRMSATELAGAIRFRQASSREVIEAHLQRIEAVNPSVNAITILLADQALEAAKAADIADGLPQAVQVIGPATAKNCAWTPPPRWRTGSASSRRSIPGSQMATGPRHGGVMGLGKDRW
jgi:amidase